MTDDDAAWDDVECDEFGNNLDLCRTCHGDGWVIVGLEVDCDDGVNGPFNNETIKCPNCHGSGKAEDCTYW
jgi:hypothetical protein